MRVVDTHAHYFPQAYLDLLASPAGRAAGFGSRPVPGGFLIDTPGGVRGPQPSRYHDLDARLADMDAQGVAVQALSLTAPMVYWADGAFSAELSQAFNDAADSAHRAHPDRLVGLAALPMQDPERAIAEIGRVRGFPGIRGVYVGTNIEGRDLSDPLFEPIYAALAAARLPMFLHPVKPLGGPRLKPFHLGNLIGNPTETAAAAAHLIFGGVLDRHSDLTVCLPHAGGSLPSLIGRYDHGYRVRKEARHLPQPPSAYLRRFYFDTITHSAPLLAALAAQVGADRIVLGSDYCADMGSERPIDVVDEAGFGPRERALILEETASRLLGL